MIKLLLEPVNFLILDEPTNHLDMRTKDILKDAIRDFNGTVIVVSHDREFLDGLVSKVYEFGGGHVKEHLGGIYDFLETKKIESLRQLELSTPNASSSTAKTESVAKSQTPNPTEEKTTGGRRNYFEQKEREREIKRREKRVATCEAEINDIEMQIKEIESTLADGGTGLPADIYERHSELNKKLDNAMSLWEIACSELEAIKQDQD